MKPINKLYSEVIEILYKKGENINKIVYNFKLDKVDLIPSRKSADWRSGWVNITELSLDDIHLDCNKFKTEKFKLFKELITHIREIQK